jgi:hypothetical protein
VERTEAAFKANIKKFEVLDIQSKVNLDVKTTEIVTRDIKCSSDINIQ